MLLLDGCQAPGVVQAVVQACAHLLLREPELVEPIGHLLRHAARPALPAAEAGGGLELRAPQAVDLAVAGDQPHPRAEVRQQALEQQAAGRQRTHLLVVRADSEDGAAARQDADMGATGVRIGEGLPILPGLEVQELREQPRRAGAGVLGLSPDREHAEGQGLLRLRPTQLDQALQALLHLTTVRPSERARQGLARDLQDSASGGGAHGHQPRGHEAEQLRLPRDAVLPQGADPRARPGDQVHGALEHDQHGL
mmetsp:Transcript_20189/g.63230  ORF Transcript_20189/g.63230 Transcript_20189/m.63230 type:complete len:253 (-) Transcript_20189:423-1181(-)